MTGSFPTCEAFEVHVGETFEVSGSTPPVPMTLSRVTSWGSRRGTDSRQPFTIHFHGPLEPLLPQAIYHFEHEGLGPLDIFIVPLGREQNAVRYEAIFA